MAALAGTLVLSSAGTFEERALANDPKVEKDVLSTDSQAMDVDFLSLDYKKAKTKLQGAIKKCGKDKCSTATLALLHRDLGLVLINSKSQKDGEKELETALQTDPKVTIAKDYLLNANVKKPWDALLAKYAPAPPPDDVDGGLGVAVKVAPVGWELPIVIEVPSGESVKSVKVSYKTDEMEKYKQIEAKKVSGKLVAILDCGATKTAGEIKFYVRAYDDGGSEVDHYASIKKPALIELKDSVTDEEKPLLPGDEEPKSCTGNEGSEEKKPDGEACEADDECETGLVCIEGGESGKKSCKPPEKVSSTGESPKLWFGLDGEVDLLFLGNETELCRAKSWACTADVNGQRQDVGVDDTKGVALRPEANTAGKTTGGTSVGTKRVFASFDYFLLPRLSLGARIGFAFGGNPTDVAKFVPFHGEVRAQYFLTQSSFRPYFLLGGGYAHLEGSVPDVVVNPNDPLKANATDPNTNQQILTGVKAYKLGGPLFIDAGIGAWIMLGKNAAINLAMKLDLPLPTFVMTLAPEAGIKFGF